MPRNMPRSRAIAYVVGLCQDITPYQSALETNIRKLTDTFADYRIVLFAGDASLPSLTSWKAREERLLVLPENQSGYDGKTSMMVHARNKLRDTVTEVHSARGGAHGGNATHPEEAFVVVMDLDDANKLEFNATVFTEAMRHSSEWDVLTFNRRNYYDIWALRHAHLDVNIWTFGDDSRTLMGIAKRDLARQLASTSAQGRRFMPVLSAFAGLGVYRLRVMQGCQYSQASEAYAPAMWLSRKGKTVYGPQGECEHVPFHACLRAKHGARIVISPDFLHTERSLLPADMAAALASQALLSRTLPLLYPVPAAVAAYPIQVVVALCLLILIVRRACLRRRAPAK